MEIISWDFLFFCVLILGLYYVLNQRAQNFLLLLASLLFFYTWGWHNLVLIVLIASLTFFAGKQFHTSNHSAVLFAAVGSIVGLLIIYRIVDISNISLGDENTNGGVFNFFGDILIPIGFSFYALQAIGYLIDIKKGRIAGEIRFTELFLYLAYFPKVLAGPVERLTSFLPQIQKPRIVNNEKLARAFTFIFIGLIRKVIIAQILFSIIPEGFLNGTIINTHPELGFFSFPYVNYLQQIAYSDRVFGIIAFGFYLYNDFAGYTGIVRGLSLLFGIDLVSNFNVPYFASSMADFWNRWHISLSLWLKEYIYFPIIRYLKMQSKLRFSAIVIPPIITMLVSGFWHGASIPLLVWGLFYGLIMVIEQFLFQKWPTFRPQNQTLLARLIMGGSIYVIVTLAWVPFSAASFDHILAFFKVLAKGSGWNIPSTMSGWFFVFTGVSLLLDIFQSQKKDEGFLLSWPMPARALFVSIFGLALIFAFTWTAQFESSVFVYQGF